MPVDNSDLQSRALDLYALYDRNASRVAAEPGMPSRISIQAWKQAGKPEFRTGGQNWDEYLDKQDKIAAEVARRKALEVDDEFMTAARRTVEEAVYAIRRKIELNEFEAKIGDLDKLLRIHSFIDQRDVEKKAWMDHIMIGMLNVIAEVVTPQQFAVIRTRYLDMNANKTKELDLIAGAQTPYMPIHEEVLGTNVPETEYEEIE